MKRIIIKEERCLGCRLCQYYCAYSQTKPSAGFSPYDLALALKDKAINPAVRIEQNGGLTFAVNCRHCEDPFCVKCCITGALTVDGGKVVINKDRCIGCYTCVLACPFGAVKPSESGTALKCELCSVPLCVRGCPNGAILER